MFDIEGHLSNLSQHCEHIKILLFQLFADKEGREGGGAIRGIIQNFFYLYKNNGGDELVNV